MTGCVNASCSKTNQALGWHGECLPCCPANFVGNATLFGKLLPDDIDDETRVGVGSCCASQFFCAVNLGCFTFVYNNSLLVGYCYVTASL